MRLRPGSVFVELTVPPQSLQLDRGEGGRVERKEGEERAWNGKEGRKGEKKKGKKGRGALRLVARRSW